MSAIILLVIVYNVIVYLYTCTYVISQPKINSINGGFGDNVTMSFAVNGTTPLDIPRCEDEGMLTEFGGGHNESFLGYKDELLNLC